MVKCENCGFLTISDRRHRCYYYKKDINPEELKKERYCSMFINKMIESGGPVSPYGHFILKISEMQDKK